MRTAKAKAFDGLRRVDPELGKLMRTLDATRWQTFRLTELPAALPAASGPIEHVVTGAKGVEGGAVLMAGQHPGWA